MHYSHHTVFYLDFDVFFTNASKGKRTIKQLLELNEQIQKAAITDSLTGLLNRRGMHAQLLSEWSRIERGTEDAALIIGDIDHFKRFNDVYGHDVGDLVLQAVGKALGSAFREYDKVARWGGEEFLILLPITTSLTNAAALAEKARQIVEEMSIAHGNKSLKVTMSLGVSALNTSSPIDSALKYADNALYRSKENGRNRVSVSQ